MLVVATNNRTMDRPTDPHTHHGMDMRYNTCDCCYCHMRMWPPRVRVMWIDNSPYRNDTSVDQPQWNREDTRYNHRCLTSEQRTGWGGVGVGWDGMRGEERREMGWASASRWRDNQHHIILTITIKHICYAYTIRSVRCDCDSGSGSSSSSSSLLPMSDLYVLTGQGTHSTNYNNTAQHRA